LLVNVEERSSEGKRLHVRRLVNDAEAAVVRRIFEQCAKGAGFRRIAHDLNAAGLSPAVFSAPQLRFASIAHGVPLAGGKVLGRPPASEPS
jgi:hypothetical protein